MPGKKIRAGRGVPKKISDWEELSKLENDEYKISGDYFIIRKSDGMAMQYLSTHFFYTEATHYDGVLNKYGFNVEVIRHSCKEEK
jgi:hypothetical protein